MQHCARAELRAEESVTVPTVLLEIALVRMKSAGLCLAVQGPLAVQHQILITLPLQCSWKLRRCACRGKVSRVQAPTLVLDASWRRMLKYCSKLGVKLRLPRPF